MSIQPGETVLVDSAAGGVGSILTQLLVRAGARVICTGSEAPFQNIRALGAEPVAYGSELAESLRGLSPISAAADLHGIATAETALRLGVPAERIVTIEAEDPPLGVQAVNGSDARVDALEKLTDLIITGQIRIPIAAQFSLTDFAEAIAFQRSRLAHGKVAIEISRP